MTNFNDTKQVYWIVAGEINPGQEATFRAISARLVELTQTEPGAPNCEWSIAEHSRSFHISERYADSEAARFHRAQVGEMLKELMLPPLSSRRPCTAIPASENSFHQRLQPNGLKLL